jgi:hypothetical protein
MAIDSDVLPLIFKELHKREFAAKGGGAEAATMERGEGAPVEPLGNAQAEVMSNSIEEKKRVVERRSPDREEDKGRRRVKGRGDGGSALGRDGGLDEIEAALPEMLDLSGRNDLRTAELMQLIEANPRASILKLDGCTVSFALRPVSSVP